MYDLTCMWKQTNKLKAHRYREQIGGYQTGDVGGERWANGRRESKDTNF